MKSPLLAALAVVVGASGGYLALTDLSVFDAVYMTFITVGTVGYGEVGELGVAGRMWTIVVIIAGYGVLVAMTARFTALLLSGSFGDHLQTKRRLRMQSQLSNHLIVIGFGRVGRATVDAAVRTGTLCAVVELQPDLAPQIESAGATPIIGDARDTEVLDQAGIARASSLVAALSDPDNLVVVSTARMMQNDLRIVSRVADLEWCARLRRAGANDLVPVYRSAGQHLALSAATTGLLGVINDVGGFIVEEIEVEPNSGLVGLSPADVMKRHPHVIVVGVRRANDLERWHEVSGPIRAGDVAVIVGPPGVGTSLA
jgi:voltage-gated potassium channel